MDANGIPKYVDLNVGGTHYTTSISTLTKYPDSWLYRIFSKTTIPLDKDKKGRYVIDRDGRVFRYILNFLRGGQLNIHTEFKEYKQLREEVKYFKLKEMRNLLNDWQTANNKGSYPKQYDDGNETEGRSKDVGETLDLDMDHHDVVDNMDCGSNIELSSECEDPWFLNTNPHRSPYIPQMGDKVMYFWQGHKCYVKAVAEERFNDIEETKYPWDRGNLKTEEPMRVVDLEYHSGPPVTCEIKLAAIDQITKKPTGKTLRLRYHVMPRIKDFMVLLQHYKISLERKWKPGDKFRAVIDNKWWFGAITEKTPMDAANPESLFQCFTIRWRNGKSDVLSPWELEPIESETEEITEREMQKFRYNSEPDEWDGSDQNTECRRILSCLDQVMSLEVSKKLTSGASSISDVDGDMGIPYPIKLETIRKRLEARFYRTKAALRWEVKQIESNANMFNEPNSEVVKSAELMTNILLGVIRNLKLEDATELYSRMVGISETKQKTKRNKPKRSRKVKMYSSEGDTDDKIETPPSKRRRSTRTHDEKRWVRECKNLLDKLFDLEESTYFRTPIDKSIYKNYGIVIKEPMDLTTVKKRMESGYYEDPHEFAKDIRLIVSNSKAYNTDRRMKIYDMTREFSRFFEDHIRDTLHNYKNAAAFKKLQPKGNGTPNGTKDQGAHQETSGDNLTDSGKPAEPPRIQKQSKVAQGFMSRFFSSTSQAKEGKVDSDSDTNYSLHASSDEEYRQPSSYIDSFQDDEHNSDSKAERGLPTNFSSEIRQLLAQTETYDESDISSLEEFFIS